jgi:hypothetical protein
MFTIFHRKKKVIVDCFTADKMVHDIVPITRAIKTVPDWWKNLPTNNYDSSDVNRLTTVNLKTCAGFLELYKRGFMIEAWGDFNFTVEPNHTYRYDTSRGKIAEHNRIQYGTAFPNHEHAKLESPWLLKCKKNHYFHFGPATWSLDKYDFTIVPGVVEFYYQTTTSINIMIPIRNEKYSFIIPAGNPMVHIIPLNDNFNYEVKNHLVSYEELNRINMDATAFYSGYNKVKKLMQRNEIRDNKCPYN